MPVDTSPKSTVTADHYTGWRLCFTLSFFLGDIPDYILDAAEGALNLSFGALLLAVRNRLLIAYGLAYCLFDFAGQRLALFES